MRPPRSRPLIGNDPNRLVGNSTRETPFINLEVNSIIVKRVTIYIETIFLSGLKDKKPTERSTLTVVNATTTKEKVPASLASEIRNVLEFDVAKNKAARSKAAQERFLAGLSPMRLHNQRLKVPQQKPQPKAIFSFRDVGRKGTNGNPIDFAVRHIIGRLQRELGKVKENLDDQKPITSRIQPEFLDSTVAPQHDLTLNSDHVFKVGEKIPAKNSRQVLIATTWRSGSSFFGDLINHYPGAFYSFEPLHFNSYTPDAAQPLNLLKALFTCKFQGPNMAKYLKHAAKHQFLFLNHNHRVAKVCSHVLPAKSACFLPSLYQRACPLFPINVIKTVRLRVEETKKLLEDSDLPNLKVIVLVRDPRGVMNSRAAMDWCAKEQCADPKTVCEHLRRDVEAAYALHKEFPDRVRLVRYEDLSVLPFEVADEVLKFLGLPHEMRLDAYLETHTQAKRSKNKQGKPRVNPYGTFRESKHTAFAWKSKMKFDYVQEIQNVCQEPMKTLGYNLMRDKVDKYDNEFPIIVKTKCDVWHWPWCQEDETMTTKLLTNGLNVTNGV